MATLLVGGNRKFAVASTDFHRGGNIASPHTVVRAEALSAEAVIDAIAAGRSYMARDTSVEIGMQVRNSATPVQHADIGDTLLRSGKMQAEFRSNTAGGCGLRTSRDGSPTLRSRRAPSSSPFQSVRSGSGPNSAPRTAA